MEGVIIRLIDDCRIIDLSLRVDAAALKGQECLVLAARQVSGGRGGGEGGPSTPETTAGATAGSYCEALANVNFPCLLFCPWCFFPVM